MGTGCVRHAAFQVNRESLCVSLAIKIGEYVYLHCRYNNRVMEYQGLGLQCMPVHVFAHAHTVYIYILYVPFDLYTHHKYTIQ